MPTVGKLQAELTGTDTGFSAMLNTGAKGAENFGKTVNTGSSTLINFNAHALESRKTIGTFAAVAGTSAGPIMHLVHAVGAFGPALGGAIAGFLMIKESLETSERLTNENTAAAVRMTNAWKGLTLTNIGAEIRTVTNELRKAQDEQKYFEMNPFLPFGSDHSEIIADREAELKRLQGKYEELKSAGSFIHGGGTHHIETTVKAQELGVFKLEHDDYKNPVVEEAKKHTELQQKMVADLDAMLGLWGRDTSTDPKGAKSFKPAAFNNFLDRANNFKPADLLDNATETMIQATVAGVTGATYNPKAFHEGQSFAMRARQDDMAEALRQGVKENDTFSIGDNGQITNQDIPWQDIHETLQQSLGHLQTIANKKPGDNY